MKKSTRETIKLTIMLMVVVYGTVGLMFADWLIRGY